MGKVIKHFKHIVLIGFASVLMGCAAPLDQLDAISDVPLPEGEASVSALPSDGEIAREGFFASDGTTPSQTDLAVSAALKEVDARPARTGGLLGFLRAKPQSATPVDSNETGAIEAAIDTSEAQIKPGAKPTQDTDQPVVTAALDADDPDARPNGWGLFSRRAAPKNAARNGPDAADVPFGTVLPFGQIARVCEAKNKPIGRRIDHGPAQGFALYDTRLGSSAPRTFYIKGFADGCPRQLTAAHVVVGAPSLYEQLYFGPGGEHMPRAQTDAAYEDIKKRLCNVRRGKPCGRAIKKMERSTVFVSTYALASDNTSWSEMLIHNGQVMATALKSAR